VSIDKSCSLHGASADVRCIAWGDCDALTESGFCYAQGIGCKKDLKKAAKFYRMAESRGISMVGNSWCVDPSSKIRMFHC
jgi:TPR repeat protein